MSILQPRPASLALALLVAAAPSLLAQAENIWTEKLKRHFSQQTAKAKKTGFRVSDEALPVVLAPEAAKGRIPTCSIPLRTVKPDESATIRLVEPDHVPKMPNIDPPAPPCEDRN